MLKRNLFIDDDNLSELSSLTHLLERNDNEDNKETACVVELDLFIWEFGNFIDSLRGLNRVSYICGDFIIDLLEITLNKYASEYFESIICSSCFSQK